MNRSIYCVLALLLIFRQSYTQQKFTISGSVRDSISGEDLIGATLTIKELPDKGAITNAYGFYSLTLPAGNYTVTLRYIGYEHRITKIDLFKNIRQNYSLRKLLKNTGSYCRINGPTKMSPTSRPVCRSLTPKR
jgi:hypothetical protein